MQRALLTIALTSCGRVGFDSICPATAPAIAVESTTETPSTCDVTAVSPCVKTFVSPVQAGDTLVIAYKGPMQASAVSTSDGDTCTRTASVASPAGTSVELWSCPSAAASPAKSITVTYPVYGGTTVPPPTLRVKALAIVGASRVDQMDSGSGTQTGNTPAATAQRTASAMPEIAVAFWEVDPDLSIIQSAGNQLTAGWTTMFNNVTVRVLAPNEAFQATATIDETGGTGGFGYVLAVYGS